MYILNKAGGFIKGICHPKKRTDLIKEAGIGWVRMDVPFPYEPGQPGVLSERYVAFRERCASLYNSGLRAMCITPYPRAFIHYGSDPASDTWLEDVTAVCKFMAADLAPYNAAWQITNEMYVFHFRAPLLPEETIPFIAAGLKGVHEGAPDAILGHNSVNTSGSEYDRMLIDGLKPYDDIVDYIGLDSYKGTWAQGEADDIIKDIQTMFELTGKPVLVQEFGFASEGTIYTQEDVLAYIHKHGYESTEAILESPELFLERIPHYIAKRIMRSPKEEWGTHAVSVMPHLLKKWPAGSAIFRHTPEGQAAFFDNLLGKMLENPHTCGAIIYSWSDDALCSGDLTADCPCETAWGLTYNDETPKPAYHVVKKYFTQA